MLGPGDVLLPGKTQAQFDAARSAAARDQKVAYAAAAGSLVFAVAAGVLGHLAWDERGAPAVRF